MKDKINKLVSPLYNKVWHFPKARLKKACDEMPSGRRLKLVAVLFSLFVIAAFFVFGHACYKMGAGHERKLLEVEHLRQLELPSKPIADEYAR